MIFPFAIQFIDTKKIKHIFSIEQFEKHKKQPIVILNQINLFLD